MKYIVGYDGGGTKTQIMVFDREGTIYFEKIGVGSNYMASGKENFIKVIDGLYQDALSALQITVNDIEYISLGLSGADLEEDHNRINKLCLEIFNDTPFKVVNDAWIILRSGLKKPHGAVAISGTGTNAAALHQNGNKAIMRSLGFSTGTYGGGLDIAREGLHYAFRSEELTYKKTLLEIEIPKLFSKSNMSEIVHLLYPRNIIPKKQFGDITRIVNECSVEGDSVSSMILSKVGTYLAENVLGMMKQVNIDNSCITVVVGGRVFDGVSPVLLDTFSDVLLKHNKQITIKKPKYKPVVGAFLLALDELGITQTDKIDKNLEKACK